MLAAEIESGTFAFRAQVANHWSSLTSAVTSLTALH